MFETVDELLRAVIGYVHGTRHGVVPHEFTGSHSLTGPGGFPDPDYGTHYYGFRAPATGKRWAISQWKMIHRHNIDPSHHSECDDPPDKSDANFIAVAMCTIGGRRLLAQMAKTMELDSILAMRKVMEL